MSCRHFIEVDDKAVDFEVLIHPHDTARIPVQHIREPGTVRGQRDRPVELRARLPIPPPTAIDPEKAQALHIALVGDEHRVSAVNRQQRAWPRCFIAFDRGPEATDETTIAAVEALYMAMQRVRDQQLDTAHRQTTRGTKLGFHIAERAQPAAEPVAFFGREPLHSTPTPSPAGDPDTKAVHQDAPGSVQVTGSIAQDASDASFRCRSDDAGLTPEQRVAPDDIVPSVGDEQVVRTIDRDICSVGKSVSLPGTHGPRRESPALLEVHDRQAPVCITRRDTQQSSGYGDPTSNHPTEGSRRDDFFSTRTNLILACCTHRSPWAVTAPLPRC